MKISSAMRLLWSALPAALLACGSPEPPAPAPGLRLVIRVDPGLARSHEPLRLRAWGPWWAPLWSHSLPERGQASVELAGPLEGLHWLTLEDGGRPAAGVRVVGGLEERVYHLELRELEVPRSVLGAERLEPFPALDPDRPFGFPGGGIALDRGNRAALWSFSSPELHLRALWLLPWRAPTGRYGAIQVEDPPAGEEWGTPEQEWVLDGPAVQVLAPAPWQRLFTSGCRLEPWPWGGELPVSTTKGPAWWAPAWEVEARPEGLVLLGHADWRRFFLTIPRAEGADLLGLWHAPALGEAEEQPPRALWRLSWSETGRRLASLQVAPRFPGLLPALSRAGQEWALLRLQESGGMGAGLEVGGQAVAIGLEGPGPPLLLLETRLTPGAEAHGLLFWSPGERPRLELGSDRSHPVGHRDTLQVTPSFEGPRAATTRTGER